MSWLTLEEPLLYCHTHIVSMLGCVTIMHPFYFILELCEDDLLHLLRVKAKLLR